MLGVQVFFGSVKGSVKGLLDTGFKVYVGTFELFEFLHSTFFKDMGAFNYEYVTVCS